MEEERRQRQLKDKQDKEQTEKLEAQRYSFEFEKISFVMAHKNCFNQAQEAEFYEIYRKSLVTILIKKALLCILVIWLPLPIFPSYLDQLIRKTNVFESVSLDRTSKLEEQTEKLEAQRYYFWL